ncbi:MAG: nodulation protein NfeD [Planctomycetes bacterium]|nr:nodulation protein NfeD [Planctomycetota bacterium]
MSRVTRPRRRALALALVALGGVGLSLRAVPTAAAAPAPRGAVVVLEVEGVINPITARYLERELRAAGDAALVVVRLDTPGGLDTAMRDMIQAILGAPAPVAVHVAPPGARAASAGMFVTLAGHVAAMAPETAIGAAHPVALGGAADDVAMSKVVNDAAAMARALAEARGRDAGWAEQAVRESLSLTAGEAAARGVVDLVARDLDELLDAVHGRVVETAAGARRIQVVRAEVVERPMPLVERALQRLAHPDLAFLLLTLGALGLLAELFNPGALVPGVAGAIALLVGFVALGNLPVGGAGLLLLGLGLLLIAGEALTPGVGVLAVGGGVAFVLGALLLYRPLGPVSPALPDLRPSPWLVGLGAGGVGAFTLLVVRAALRSRHEPVATGVEALLGRRGVATTDLAPHGTVRIDLEAWLGEAAGGGTIYAGEDVVVVAVEGVTVKVQRAPARVALGGGPRSG